MVNIAEQDCTVDVDGIWVNHDCHVASLIIKLQWRSGYKQQECNEAYTITLSEEKLLVVRISQHFSNVSR